MTAKPSDTIDWASAGSIVEPGSGKKATGFVGGDQPPAEHLNWLFAAIESWLKYIETPDDITLGADKLASTANALAARLTASAANFAVAPMTLMFSLGHTRVYALATDAGAPGIVIASNCQIGTAGTWTKITNSQIASVVQIRRDAVVSGHMPAAQNTAWLNAFVTGAGTTSGFGRVVNLPFDGTQDDSDAADDARLYQAITAEAGVERVLLATFARASQRPIRIYYAVSTGAGDAGAIEIVLNASYENSTNLWSRSTASIAAKLVFSATRFSLLWAASGSAASTFADTSWTQTPLAMVFPTGTTSSTDHTTVTLGNGAIVWDNSQSDDESDCNPPYDAAIPNNNLCAKNIPKAWAVVEDTGSGLTIHEGYGIASVTRDTTDRSHVFTLTRAMSDANYAPGASACPQGESVGVSPPTTAVVNMARVVSSTVFRVYGAAYSLPSSTGAITGVSVMPGNGERYRVDVYGQQDS